MNNSYLRIAGGLWLVWVCTALGAGPKAPEPGKWLLLPRAETDGQGVFLSQVIAPIPGRAMPRVRLSDPPPFGRAGILTREQVMQVARALAPELVSTNWGGAETVKVYRRTRTLSEAELLKQLTTVLQRDHVGDKGEVELSFNRAWKPVVIPDDALNIKILDLPNGGVTAYFIVRFELSTDREVLGAWHVSLQGKIWREIWVANDNLTAGALVSTENVVRERRDVMALRETLVEDLGSGLEMVQRVRSGTPLYARLVRVRPVVFRGQMVEALVRSGPILVSLKVEAMESGAPGDVIRVRNTQSRKMFRGKVQDEQTILVSL